MTLTPFRRRAVTVFASFALLTATATGGVVAAATSAAAADPCTVKVADSGRLTAGFYSGNTVIPSTSQVTSAGKEAQCLLWYWGYNVTIDGVFGPKSQTAAKAFQSSVNASCKPHHLDVDGSIGPKTWPFLRSELC